MGTTKRFCCSLFVSPLHYASCTLTHLCCNNLSNHSNQISSDTFSMYALTLPRSAADFTITIGRIVMPSMTPSAGCRCECCCGACPGAVDSSCCSHDWSEHRAQTQCWPCKLWHCRSSHLCTYQDACLLGNHAGLKAQHDGAFARLSWQY